MRGQTVWLSDAGACHALVHDLTGYHQKIFNFSSDKKNHMCRKLFRRNFHRQIYSIYSNRAIDCAKCSNGEFIINVWNQKEVDLNIELMSVMAWHIDRKIHAKEDWAQLEWAP